MKFSHISIGAGITGIETILALTKEVDRKKKYISPKFLVGIIDKNPENISGGVGYGFKISKYGFFNNPIRLSPKPFRKWLSDKKIKEKIIHYLKIWRICSDVAMTIILLGDAHGDPTPSRMSFHTKNSLM